MLKKVEGLTPLTISLRSYVWNGHTQWKARIQIHMVMTNVPVKWFHYFIRDYLRKASDDSRREAIEQIQEWFPVAESDLEKISKDAVQKCVSEYKWPIGGPSKKEKDENAKLTKAVESAKSQLKRFKIRRDVFLEECRKAKLITD